MATLLDFNHIICGTDFTETPVGSVREALRLIHNRPGSQVTVVHVTSKARSSWGEIEARLNSWVSALPEYAAVADRVSPLVHAGKISTGLTEAAEAVGAGLIVVGPMRKGLVQQVIGGIAEQLFGAASVPVLATAEPLSGGYEHILVPIDFSPGSVHALKLAAEFVRDTQGAVAKGAHLDLIHAYTFPGGVHAGSVRQNLESQIKPRLENDLKTLAKKQGVSDIVNHYHVAFGPARDVIIAEANALNVDMICMSSSSGGNVTRALLGSTASSILLQSECPLLVISPPQS